MHYLKIALLAFIYLAISASIAFAQKRVTGKVTDHTTNEPINCACIRYNGKLICTDNSGNFQLNLPNDTTSITVSCIGYQTKTIKVKDLSKNLVINLDKGNIDLKEITIASALSNGVFHTLSSLDLNLRPVNSSQDLLRLVPGLFIAQHMGGGKAEQIFLRGFDADHGTDINVSVDGMPVNMVSHIHGQGYADLHFLIPETVSTFEYGKGPYYSNYGDFNTAGYITFNTKDAIDKSLISIEAGQFNSLRLAGVVDLLGAKARQNGENAYIAAEYNYTDGAFKLAEHYKRTNIFGKYTKKIGDNNKLSFSASTFSTSWIASGEIPARAAATGTTTAIDENGLPYQIAPSLNTIDRFGTIDSAQGGKTTRTNANLKLSTNLKNNWTMENQLYYTHNTFELNVNSTFFADDEDNGDLRHQNEARDMFGYNGSLIKKHYFGNNMLTSTIGLSSRYDMTYGSVINHVDKHYQFLETVLQGNTKQNNSAIYLDESLELGKWLFNLGSRIDYFNFNFHDSTKTSVIVSPKLNIQYTVDPTLQFYVKAGKGFHSNKAAAVIGNNGLQTLPSAYGADLGFNWKPIPHLYINTALWYLYLDQEFVLSDDGTIVPGGKTTRAGVDFSARYQLASWLFADLNVNLARPRLADSAKNTGYLALAPTFTSTGGLDFRFDNGINGGLSYRYMHSRPGNNTNTLVADGYFVTDLKLNYTQKRYEVGITIENLLNTKWNEFEAEEVSRLKGESAAVDQMSFTPGTPFFAKLRVAYFFK